MLKRVWRQLPSPRSSLFHIPALPPVSDHVHCSLATVRLFSTRLTCTSRRANLLGWEKCASSSLSMSRVPNRLPAQMIHMAGLPHMADRLSTPWPSFDERVCSNLKCSQPERRGHIFPTSVPNKSIHGSSLLVSSAPLLNGYCSSRPFSTFTCPLPLFRLRIRCNGRLLEAEKLQLSLTSSPFSSAPSKEEKPKSTWGKLKQMVKDYWYIIIPVEVATSIFWYGSIYFSLQSGLDIVSLLESLGASEATLAKLPSAEAGYHALAFICYKVISPLRHAISLAISSIVVTRLEKTRPGYLRTSGQLAQEGKERSKEGVDYVKARSEDAKERYEERREDLREKYEEAKERYEDAKERYGDKKEEIKDEMKERMERLNKLYQSMKKR